MANSARMPNEDIIEARQCGTGVLDIVPESCENPVRDRQLPPLTRFGCPDIEPTSLPVDVRQPQINLLRTTKS
jgi:hypothetical protein